VARPAATDRNASKIIGKGIQGRSRVYMNETCVFVAGAVWPHERKRGADREPER
jgi:hypothetical protein